MGIVVVLLFHPEEFSKQTIPVAIIRVLQDGGLFVVKAGDLGTSDPYATMNCTRSKIQPQN
eukprot:1909271-Amphidinium_carterae.1